jgi:hypothetical protein
LARYTFGQDAWIRAKTSISQQLTHDKADSNPEKKKSLDDLLPKAYHEYKSVFEKEASECFPKSRPWDHAIDLKPDFILKDCKVYPLTLAEQTKLDNDDAWPGKQNKTPKYLFSTTQARGRKRGGLNGYHQHQGRLNAKGGHYSWGICDIRYELGHPKIFRVRKTVSLKFGLVRFWLGLCKTVITMQSASANPAR